MSNTKKSGESGLLSMLATADLIFASALAGLQSTLSQHVKSVIDMNGQILKPGVPVAWLDVFLPSFLAGALMLALGAIIIESWIRVYRAVQRRGSANEMDAFMTVAVFACIGIAVWSLMSGLSGGQTVVHLLDSNAADVSNTVFYLSALLGFMLGAAVGLLQSMVLATLSAGLIYGIFLMLKMTLR